MKRLIRMLITTFFTLAVFITASYAWFTHTEFVEPNVSGYSVAAYFGGGDGSAEKPFLIKNQRHLYNLAWLQYLGYFNQKGEGNVKDNTKSTLTQYSFKIEAENNTLNMDGWVLPPIGTAKDPFIGSLDGNGTTIINLETSNDFSDLERHPSTVDSSNFNVKDEEDSYSKCDIVGFIGAIGPTDIMNYKEYSSSVSSSANNVHDLILQNATVTTESEQTLIGSVAGYVNGKIENVGVKNATLNINTNAAIDSLSSDLSKYAVAGYATEEYTTAVTKNATTIFNPTTTYSHFNFNGMGDNNDWGGSIDMASLYSRINNRINETKLNSYVKQEIKYFDINGNEDTSKNVTVSGSPSSNHYYKEYNNGSGAYLTQNTAPYNGYDYLTALYKDVIKVSVDGTRNGYKIKSPNGYYLNLKSERASSSSIDFNVSLTKDTDVDNATVWIEDEKYGGYSLYAYDENTGYKVYLSTNDYSALTLSYSDTSTWDYDALYGYYINYSNTRYYLRYISNNWVLSNQLSYYITDNRNNYLTRDNNSIKNETDYSKATRWIFENESTKSGRIYDESDTNYKLNTNGTSLSITTATNSTSWSNDLENRIIYTGNSYIIYDNGWKIYHPNSHYITYNGNYLSIDNGTIENVSSIDDATIWNFSDYTNIAGTISTEIEGNTYYLKYDNGLTQTTDPNDATTWIHDEYGIYVTANSKKYYIQFKDNIWQTLEIDIKGYYISYNGNYYLNKTVYFHFDSNNKVYGVINGTTRYLRVNASAEWGGFYYSYSLTTTTNANDNYMLIYNSNDNTISASNVPGGLFSSNKTIYMYYNNGWTVSENSQTLTIEVQKDDYAATTVSVPISYVSDSLNTRPNMNRYQVSTNTYSRSSAKSTPSVFNYIPLNTDANNVVKNTNTGYIMSGGHSGNSGGLTAVDIRVAGEAGSYNIPDRLTTSVADDGTIRSNKVYTYDSTGLHTINDSSNTYQKYTSSRSSLQDTLQSAPSQSGKKVVSGIHFITSLISMDNLVTAPSVMINGKKIPNYQMPENSIDFQLASKGYINFFATLYYPGSTTFFSLYDIKRDENQKIIAINHIKEIYQNDNDKSQDFIYKYESEDPTTGFIYSNKSNSLASGYSKVFDTTWIETPTFTKNQFEYNTSSSTNYLNNGWYMKKLFYFEIPVNKGEFALGSVDGRDGGYLLYLDIGANAAAVDRTTITQESKTEVSDYTYVNGIQILATGDSFSYDYDSAVATIGVVQSGTVGQVVISRTTSNNNDTISFANANSFVSTYADDGIALSSNVTRAGPTSTTTRKVLKYIDYNRSINNLYQTTIINDGTNNISYEVYRLNPTTYEKMGDVLDYNGMNINDRKAATYGLLSIYNNGGVASGKREDSFTTISITTSEAVHILDYDLYVDTTKKNTITETIEMNIARATGTTTIVNSDPSVNNYTTSNGRIVLTGETAALGYNQDTYTLEYVYMPTGNDVTITSGEDTTVTVRTISGTYTFTINEESVSQVNDTVDITA